MEDASGNHPGYRDAVQSSSFRIPVSLLKKSYLDMRGGDLIINCSISQKNQCIQKIAEEVTRNWK